VASPTEDSAVVGAAEIQYTHTAKEAFKSGAVADSVGDADATMHVLEVPKSLKRIFSKRPTSQPQSKVDKTRAVYTPPWLFREVLIIKRSFFTASNAAVADLMRF
jgi:hypothetical protein